MSKGKPDPYVPESRFNWRIQYDDVRDKYEQAMSDVDASQPLGMITNQSFAADADLNEMVRRFGITDGAIPPRALDPSYFGDFTEAPTSYRDAIDRIHDAEKKFLALPANVRARFQHDPAELWQFLSDPANDEEAIKLGLLARLPDPEKETPPTTEKPAEK